MWWKLEALFRTSISPNRISSRVTAKNARSFSPKWAEIADEKKKKKKKTFKVWVADKQLLGRLTDVPLWNVKCGTNTVILTGWFAVFQLEKQQYGCPVYRRYYSIINQYIFLQLIIIIKLKILCNVLCNLKLFFLYFILSG